MIQEALFTRLSGFAGLAALVSTRLYYRLMPQNPVYPAITFFKVSETRESAMGADPGIAHGRFQFDVWDTDADSVRNVTEQVRLALERWRGTNLGGGAGLQVFDSFIDNVQEPGPELVDAVTVFRSITDVLIHYTE